MTKQQYQNRIDFLLSKRDENNEVKKPAKKPLIAADRNLFNRTVKAMLNNR